MKKLNVFLLIVLGIALISCKPTSQQGADYNNQIIALTDAVVVDQYGQFLKTWQRYDVDNPDYAELKADFKSYQAQIKTSMDGISSLKKFDGKNEFKDAAIEYLSAYQSTCDNEWKEILDILKQGEDISSRDLSRCDDIAVAIDKKVEKADKNFAKFQKSFAKKYNFELVSE
ncbi:MAG: hypothetical protein AUJ97_01610 [Bacteroidetes bacterium CG2_30_32_10]|nr:MAG: hypothetical protein AUJ97_01610 [Bacteroidetes bacterium CG2_30_32_10]